MTSWLKTSQLRLRACYWIPTQRRAMLGLPPGDTDPLLDDMSDGEPDFEEPMELVDARARLAELVHARGGEALAGARGRTRLQMRAHAARAPGL
jgi:hypothetical protein